MNGILFLILSLTGVRTKIAEAIPAALKIGVQCGIGLFIAFIGLKNAGIVVASPATIVTMGDITSFPAVMAALGFFLIIAMVHRGLKAAVIFSILIITVLGMIFGDVQYQVLVSMPPSIMPTFIKMDLSSVL